MTGHGRHAKKEMKDMLETNGHREDDIVDLKELPTLLTADRLLPPPATLEETGLRATLVEELALKALHYQGRATGYEVSRTLTLPFPVLRQSLEALKGGGLCEVVGSQGLGEQGYEYVLSDAGKGRVQEVLQRSAYTGPAPVPFAQYVSVMERQLAQRPVVTREALLARLEHLVVPEGLVSVLGSALSSGRPILLYGPSGNGKTSLALALGEALAGLDPIWIPRFLEAGGNLVRLFDPALHQRVPEEALTGATLLPEWAPGLAYDRRWVLIRRPQVVVGGELTLSQFELSLEPGLHFYHAPLQVKAAGGTLLIDDFGRQAMRPQELLNRWIVPLERRQDLLTFPTGQTMEVPLYLTLIFATNLDPEALVDEAYLRRLRYRIPIPNPSLAQFRRILQQACARAGLTYQEAALEYLRETWYDDGRPMRGCHPGDIIGHLEDLCRFEGRAPALLRELLARACAIYFQGQDRVAGAPEFAGPG